MILLDLTVRALQRAERVAVRAEVAWWLLRGGAVIYGAHLEAPLKIRGGERLLIKNCVITADSAAMVYVPSAWSGEGL